MLGLSKKDPVLRRRELLGPPGPKGLGALLARLCVERAGELVRHAVGCDVLLEVARGGQDGEGPGHATPRHAMLEWRKGHTMHASKPLLLE